MKVISKIFLTLVFLIFAIVRVDAQTKKVDPELEKQLRAVATKYIAENFPELMETVNNQLLVIDECEELYVAFHRELKSEGKLDKYGRVVDKTPEAWKMLFGDSEKATNVNEVAAAVASSAPKAAAKAADSDAEEEVVEKKRDKKKDKKDKKDKKEKKSKKSKKEESDSD